MLSNNTNQISNSTNIQQFDSIKKWLSKNHKKYVDNDQQLSSKVLYQLLIQLMQFQEEAFGKNVKNPPLTRLPVSHSLIHSRPYPRNKT